MKKTKFIPCFGHASEIYFIFYVLQVNFFCVSLQAICEGL